MWKDMWNADKILPWNHQWVGTVEISATGITSWFFFSEASGSEPQNVWTANPVQTPELASDREAVLGVPPHYSLTSLVSPAPYLWGLAPLSISRLLTWWWYLAPIRCRPIHLCSESSPLFLLRNLILQISLSSVSLAISSTPFYQQHKL